MLDILRRGKEKFLLLEIAPKRTSGVLVSVDEDKNIIPEKFWEDFSFGKFASDPIEGLRKKSVIVGVDPAFATTLTSPFSITRREEEALRPLSFLELEGLFQKELGHLSESHKDKAGSSLGLEAHDAVLVDVRASGFRVDGHLVMNPLGFHAKNIEGVVELTFTSRQIFDDLREFFKAKEGFFFTTLPKASIFALSRVELPPLKFLFLRPNESHIFILDKTSQGESSRAVKLSWKMGALFEEMARSFSASPGVVLDIYDRYARRSASDGFLRNLDRVLNPVLGELQKELSDAGLRGRIYVFSPLPLPFSSLTKQKQVSLEPIPLHAILERFGARIRLADWLGDESGVFLRLAPLFEFYFGKTDSEINRGLRRRLHWLIPT